MPDYTAKVFFFRPDSYVQCYAVGGFAPIVSLKCNSSLIPPTP